MVRIVSSQSDDDIRRKRAREELVWPLRELTANLLRVAKGGGKPHYLPKQLNECLKAFGAYAEVHGTLPPAHEIFEILDPDNAFRDARPWVDENRKAMGEIADGDTGETEREIAIGRIRRGALQAVASMLLDQLPQISMGEHDIYEGIRQLEDARAKNNAYYSNPKRAKRSLDETLKILKQSKRKSTKPKGSGPDDEIIL
jgi:hypothetical protein